MKKILNGVVLGMVAAFASSQLGFADDAKVAVVDMQKAIQTVEAGKKAKTQMEKEIKNKEKEIQTEETALKKATEDFQKQTAVLSDEAKAKKQGEIQERIMKYQQMRGRAQSDLQQKEIELTKPIVEKLRTLISELGKSKGYTLVLEKNEQTVLYSLDKDDLTNELIAQYNSKNK